jgi:hypothetical protein
MAHDKVESLAKDIKALSALDTLKLAVGLIESKEKDRDLIARIIEMGLIKYRYRETEQDDTQT